MMPKLYAVKHLLIKLLKITTASQIQNHCAVFYANLRNLLYHLMGQDSSSQSVVLIV